MAASTFWSTTPESFADRTIKKMSLEEFESIIRVNLTGTFIATQKAMSILRNGDGL